MRTNLTSLFTDIADAIRAKKGTSDQISPQDFASEIEGITAGSGSGSGDSFDETQFHKITAIFDASSFEINPLQVINSYATAERMFVNGIEVEEPDNYYTPNEPGPCTVEIWVPTENWQTELSGLFKTSDPDIVILPNSINEIPHEMFNRSFLKTVIIPTSVTSIGDYAFSDCIKLTDASVPIGVTSIGEHAFDNCYNMQEASIPASVTSIGDYAFKDCSGLHLAFCLAVTPPVIGTSIFTGCEYLTTIYVPIQSLEAYKTAAGWSEYADIIKGTNRY